MVLSLFGPINNETPKGVYSIDHLCLFLFFVSLIIIGLLLFRKFNKEKIRKLTRIFAIIITSLELIKIIYHFYYHNQASLDSWVPLHYCSLFIYALWFASSKHKTINKIGSIMLTTGCMVSGFSYLCYPSTSITYVGMFHYIALYAFFFHSSMLFFGLLYLITGYYKPQLKDFIYYLIFTSFFAILAIIINSIFNSNLMFLHNDYMLPNIVHKIYLLSPYLYTFCAYLAYLSIFFIPIGIIFIIDKIKNKYKNS